MWFLGIDPGKTGGIAWLDDDSGEMHAIKMPATYRDVWEAIRNPPSPSDPPSSGDWVPGSSIRAVLELATGMIKGARGVQGMVSLRESYGACWAFVTAAHFRLERVAPVKWQREFGLLRKSKTETDTQKKNRHKAKAQELFPAVEVTHAIADAMLLTEYCRRTQG